RGLGLSTCAGIVKERAGRMSLAPGGAGSGRGVTFRVELPAGDRMGLSPPPARRGAGGGTETAVAAVARERPERLRVLVVDDEPHILHYMQATLESWGHEVVLACDG